MKKFKILMALIAIVTMITTVAFAADESMDGYGLTVPESVELIDGATTFQVKLTKGFTVDAMAFQLYYDHDVWTVTTDSTLTVTAKPKYDDFICSSETTFADGEVLATITATAKDAEKAVTAAGAFEIKEVWSEGAEDYLWCEGVYKTITVKESGPVVTPATMDSDIDLKASVTAGSNTYENVLVGNFAITPGTDTVKGFNLTFASKYSDKDKFFSTGNLTGSGTFKYSVVIIGAPSDHEAAATLVK